MQTRPRRPSSYALAALAAACASVAAPAAHARDAAGWTPALAALGDRGTAGTTAAAAPTLAASAMAAPLLAAGMQATAVTPAEPVVVERTSEFERDETERWVPGFAFTSGILGQNAEGSVSSNSAISYRIFARQNGPLQYNNRLPFPCNNITAAQFLITRRLADSRQPPPDAGPQASGS